MTQGSGSSPAGVVLNSSGSKNGNGLSVPPRNGTGELESARSAGHVAEGESVVVARNACLSDDELVILLCRVGPTLDGSRLRP
jgi:hypothetical protein